MSEYTLQLFSPPPEMAELETLAFDGADTIFTTSTNLMGFDSCNVGGVVRTPREVIPAWLPRRVLEDRVHAHMRVSNGVRLIWEGRRKAPKFQRGEIMGLDGLGYASALGDDPYLMIADTTLTSGALLKTVLQQTLPFLRFGSDFNDPGILHALSEFDQTTPAQIVDQITTEGGNDGRLWNFSVWENFLTRLTSQIRPKKATYRLPWDMRLDLSYDDDDLWTHVAVQYTPSGGVQTLTPWQPALTDTSDLGRLGLSLPRKIIINGGELTDDGAVAFRNAFWSEHRIRRWSGQATLTPENGGLARALGGRVVLDTVRAGSTVEIMGMDPLEGPLWITATSWKSWPEQLSLTLGNAPTRGADLFRRYHLMISALASGRNPITKGKVA